MRHSKNNDLALTGLFICLVTISTMFIKISIPMTQGYVHLGDSMIFLSVLVLGTKKGTIAGSLGSALGDFLGGYPMWVPWTLVIKGLMPFVVGIIIYKYRKNTKHSLALEIFAMTIGGIVMCIGYYIAASIMYGSWYTPLFSIPWNIGQFIFGIVISLLLQEALCHTTAKKYFHAAI